MDTDIRVEDDWSTVVGFLPDDLEELAVSTGALLRRREIRSASDLVRLALVYALDDSSLRETSAWAQERGIAEFSDVAVLKRLRRSVPLLRALCSRLLNGRATPLEGYRLVIEDATTISRQRSEGTDFRVHVAYSPTQAQFVGLELTRSGEGERLDRLNCGPGDILLGDIAYQARVGLAAVRAKGAHALVRFYPTSLPLEDLSGVRLHPLDLSDALRVGEILDVPVRTVGSAKAESVEGRLVVIRKPDHKVEEQIARKKRESGKEPGPESRWAERYVMLFTSLPKDLASAETILEMYRIRWQVEMAFKRIKGVISMGETLARDMELCESKILGKLLTLLLIQAYENAFFPWGYPLPRLQSVPSAQGHVSKNSIRHRGSEKAMPSQRRRSSSRGKTPQNPPISPGNPS